MIGEKRSELEILRDILELAIRGERRTRIMYRANLSYEMLNRYLGVLVERRFLLPTESGGFVVTEQGRVLLQDIERLMRHFATSPEPASGPSVSITPSAPPHLPHPAHPPEPRERTY